MTFAFGDGPATGILAEAAFLLRTGWTLEQYERTPDDLIEAMWILLNAQTKAQTSSEQIEE